MIDAKKNYEKSKELIGYKTLKEMSDSDYKSIGFKCGLEVHQQLKTQKKLFCRCEAGLYQKDFDFDAEVIRHMRPTLSELGEYDGTALMEFRTKKNITYRVKYDSACTYDIDDTPPFLMNKEALTIAIEIASLFKQNLVGEFHITRKQYLDGSIPTGFQRTGIIGVAGEFPISTSTPFARSALSSGELNNKKIQLIQISIEEDACREVSDIGHNRIYMTDRLGMPLIEIVTHPDMLTPWEAAEAGHYIRFVTRSTGKVRVGHGAARQDVNVSVPGGRRVEIKGVGRIALIPKLTHNEAFRQRALLAIQKELGKRVKKPKEWNVSFHKFSEAVMQEEMPQLKKTVDELNAFNRGSLIAVNLPKFKGLLSFFTQPGRFFAHEISDRLKVIACLEKSNMLHSEELGMKNLHKDFEIIAKKLKAGKDDAQIIFYAQEADVRTAIETISERCQLAFEGVPDETRKAKTDGTTLFERVLPGPDRMYPDTDSAPIPITEDEIEIISKSLPLAVSDQMEQLKAWQAPKDTYHYILRYNLMPIIRRVVDEFSFSAPFVCAIFGHDLKHIQGQITSATEFDYNKVYGLFKFVASKKLDKDIIKKMLPVVYGHPHIDFESILKEIKFKPANKKQIKEDIPSLSKKFTQINTSKNPQAKINWIMGQIRQQTLGSLPLRELHALVEEGVHDD